MRSGRIPREAIAARLAEVGYVADRDLATALWMMDYLKRPLLIEGEAGVGKTEVAKALAAVHGCELIREGSNHAIWSKQQRDLRTPVPRHREVPAGTARAICRQLGIPSPENPR